MSGGLPKDLFHQEQYTVRTYEIDQHKRMTIPALVRLMQEAAMQHVLQLQLSVWDLEPEHLAWVLMRLELEVSRLPLLQESIVIKTRPTALEKILTYRGFWVYDTAGQLIARATTHWVLMDTQSRRLRPIPAWIRERFVQLIPKEEAINPARKKLPELEVIDHQKSFRARWHDLDFNLHLNNTYYILYLLEALPPDFLNAHQLKALDIHYKSEVGTEEIFQVQVQQIGSHQLLHRMMQADKILAEMLTNWQSLDGDHAV